MTLALVLSWLRKVPHEVWLLLAVALVVLWLRSHWIGVGVERCQQAQEAAEKRADAKAAAVAKDAQARTNKARERIQRETTDDAEAIRQEMDDARVCPEPVQPDGVRERGRAAVEAARRGLQAD